VHSLSSLALSPGHSGALILQWYNNHFNSSNLPMSGTLYVVATPIGNLEDITLRALRVLREATVIAAEDTRRTARLLAHHAISTRMISFHQHNVRTRLPELLERLRRGETVALVTDAGTPGISDPGVELVRTCIDNGVLVDPLPGPSASLAAAVASGFPLDPLTICGFSPIRSNDRVGWFRSLASTPHTVTFFDAPHRIRRTLSELSRYLGERQIMVAREMTKLHQEFLWGTAADVERRLRTTRGEFTLVISPNIIPVANAALPSEAEVAGDFLEMTKNSPGGRRSAIQAIALKHGIRVREVYKIIERHK
jgi:16S rRNA (cytidine1402-2'-O)-methyltransferase